MLDDSGRRLYNHRHYKYDILPTLDIATAMLLVFNAVSVIG